jgi:hypothetical protein
MLSLFYNIKVAQNGGRRLQCMFCTAWLCYAELFERFPAFPRWFQLLLQFLPQDHVVSPLESHTPGFACTPRERIQWSQVRGVKSPGYRASMSNLSVAKGFIQIHTTIVYSVACWGAIILEPITWPPVWSDWTHLSTTECCNIYFFTPCIWFGVPTLVVMKSSVFWDIMPCRPQQFSFYTYDMLL